MLILICVAYPTSVSGIADTSTTVLFLTLRLDTRSLRMGFGRQLHMLLRSCQDTHFGRIFLVTCGFSLATHVRDMSRDANLLGSLFRAVTLINC